MGFFTPKINKPVPDGVPLHPDTGLPLDIKDEIVKCATDPVYFIDTYIWTKSGGTVRFKLYPFQKQTLRDFVDHRMKVVLKSRQMGITVLSAAYVVWFTIFKSSKDVVILSKKQRDATKTIDKVKFMIKRLPKWMRQLLNIERFEIDNRESIHLFNGSKVSAESTTKDAARGDTLSLLIIDEAAAIPRAQETWESLEATLQVCNGECIVLSTPKGVGNWFHSVFVEAEAGINGFYPIILGWELLPGRTIEWAEAQIRQWGESHFAKEYACRFDQSAQTLFPKRTIDRMEKWILKLAPKKEAQNSDLEGLWTWFAPEPGHHYIVAADTAEGEDEQVEGEDGTISKTDFSAAVVIDIDTGIICATYYAKIRPGPYAKVLYQLCQRYNQALFVYDATGGWSGPLYDRFVEWNYPRMYHQPKGTNRFKVVNLLDERNKAGFMITASTRPTILSNLEQTMSTLTDEDDPLFYCKRIYNEVTTFIRTKKDRYEASEGKHDDLVMAMAIGYYVRLQWLMYHGGMNGLAEATLAGLRTNRKMRGGVNFDGPSEGYVPITGSQYRKDRGSFEKAFRDPKTGEDLRIWLSQGAPTVMPPEQHDDELQRRIDQYPFGTVFRK